MSDDNVVQFPGGRRAQLWAKADAVHGSIIDGSIAFGEVCAELIADGVKQQEIAERYGMSQSTVAMALAIGRDDRITIGNSLLPRSWRTLYEITKLTDEEFEQLVRPEMTRQEVIDCVRQRPQLLLSLSPVTVDPNLPELAEAGHVFDPPAALLEARRAERAAANPLSARAQELIAAYLRQTRAAGATANALLDLAGRDFSLALAWFEQAGCDVDDLALAESMMTASLNENGE